MSELEPTRLNIIGDVKGKRAIQDARLQLAKSHGVEIERVCHCIDGITHRKLGKNIGFTATREKGKPQTHLMLVRPDGGQEIVPHRYIGSVIHYGLSTENQKRMVHFYIKTMSRKTPVP